MKKTLTKKAIKRMAQCAFDRTYIQELNRCEYRGSNTCLAAIGHFVAVNYGIDLADIKPPRYKWLVNVIQKQADRHGYINAY